MKKKLFSGPIVDYLNYITSLDFNTEPNYPYVKKIFTSGIGSGDSINKPFQFTTTQKTPVKRKSDSKMARSPKKKSTKTTTERIPSEDEKENDVDTVDEKDKEEILETFQTSRKGRMRNKINYKEDSDGESNKSKRKLLKKTKSPVSKDLHVTGDNLDGYTDAMKEVLIKRKQKSTKKHKIDDLEDDGEDMAGYTDEMKNFAMKKKLSKKGKNLKPITSSTSNRARKKYAAEVVSDDQTNGYLGDSD